MPAYITMKGMLEHNSYSFFGEKPHLQYSRILSWLSQVFPDSVYIHFWNSMLIRNELCSIFQIAVAFKYVKFLLNYSCSSEVLLLCMANHCFDLQGVCLAGNTFAYAVTVTKEVVSKGSKLTSLLHPDANVLSAWAEGVYSAVGSAFSICRCSYH